MWLTRDDGEVYGVLFDCPCGACSKKVGVTFQPVQPTGWDRSGDTFETLTVSPSLLLRGHWHGWLKDGLVTSC